MKKYLCVDKAFLAIPSFPIIIPTESNAMLSRMLADGLALLTRVKHVNSFIVDIANNKYICA